MTEKEPHQLEEEGNRAFAAGRYAEAARLFDEASRGFTLGRDNLRAAEMDNNRSVALLKGDQPGPALDAAAGTDKIFESNADVKKQAMALGNQAAALEASSASMKPCRFTSAPPNCSSRPAKRTCAPWC